MSKRSERDDSSLYTEQLQGRIADLEARLEASRAATQAQMEGINGLMLRLEAERKALEKEARRADCWVKAARDAAQALGLEADDSKGSIQDWKLITGTLKRASAAERDAARWRFGAEHNFPRRTDANGLWYIRIKECLFGFETAEAAIDAALAGEAKNG